MLSGKEELDLHTQTRHPGAAMSGMSGKKAGDKAREERAEKKASEKPLT